MLLVRLISALSRRDEVCVGHKPQPLAFLLDKVAAREYIEAHKSIPSVGRTEAAVRQEMTKVREDVVEQLRIGLGDAPLPA